MRRLGAVLSGTQPYCSRFTRTQRGQCAVFYFRAKKGRIQHLAEVTVTAGRMWNSDHGTLGYQVGQGSVRLPPNSKNDPIARTFVQLSGQKAARAMTQGLERWQTITITLIFALCEIRPKDRAGESQLVDDALRSRKVWAGGYAMISRPVWSTIVTSKSERESQLQTKASPNSPITFECRVPFVMSMRSGKRVVNCVSTIYYGACARNCETSAH